MKGNAAGIVTMTSLGMLTIGTGKSVVVDKKMPPFRFFLATAIAATTLATIAMVDEDTGKGLSLIIIIVVCIDDLPPLLRELDGKGDNLGVKDYLEKVEDGEIKIPKENPKGLVRPTPNGSNLLAPKTQTKTRRRVTTK